MGVIRELRNKRVGEAFCNVHGTGAPQFCHVHGIMVSIVAP